MNHTRVVHGVFLSVLIHKLFFYRLQISQQLSKKCPRNGFLVKKRV